MNSKKINQTLESTGVFDKDGNEICVSHKVETKQGTKFEVVKLEHSGKIIYALHDGKRPYDLEEYMSENLKII